MPFEYPSPDGYPDVAVAWHGTLLWRCNFAGRLGLAQIQGTSFDYDRLAKLASHVLGRTPHANELAVVEA